MYIFTAKRKSIKKGWKILVIILAAIFLLISALYLVSQNRSVQTYLTRKLANKFSEQFNTEIHIGGVDIAFFNKVILENIWAEDIHQDTLVFIERLEAGIDSFSVKKKYISFKNIGFENSKMKIHADSSGNFNYVLPEIKRDSTKSTSVNWRLYCQDFNFEGAEFRYSPGPSVQKNNIDLNDINFSIQKFKIADDSMSFILNGLSLKSSEGLNIINSDASIKTGSGKIEIKNISLRTIKSEISETNLIYEVQKDSTSENPEQISLNIGNSKISFEDLAIFIPSLKGTDQLVDFSGNINGSLASLSGNDIYLRTGNNTVVNCNFYLNGLPEIDNLFLFFDLNNLQTSFNDLSNINLPEISKIKNVTFPESFYQAGNIKYRGNFTGFLTDFVAYGNMESQMGEINTDLSFVPLPGGKLQLDGKLSTTDFRLGELFKSPDFGNITFDGEVKGEYDKTINHIKGTYTGGISNFEIKDYTFKDIILDGIFEDKNFDGMINIDDPNLRLDFLGKIHLNPEIPEFDFDLSLRKADLQALKIDTINSLSELAIIVKANFKGNNIDNLNGIINIENGSYRNQVSELIFQDVKVNTETKDSTRILTFNSDFLDAKIDGDYNLRKLPKAFKNVVAKYLPSLQDSTNNDYQNNFKFDLQVKNLDNLTEVFLPGTTIETPFSVEGEINTQNKIFLLNSTIPSIISEKLALKDILFRAETNDKYSAKIGVGHIESKSGINLYNVALNCEAEGNYLNTRITWNNFHLLTYSGEIDTRAELSRGNSGIMADVEVFPSRIYIADTLWNINPSKIIIDSSSVSFNKLSMHDKTQSILIDGKISEDVKDRISVTFKNIRLKQIENYLQEEKGFKGIVNGTVELEDFYNKKLLYSDLNISGLEYKGQELGDIFLINKWDNFESIINTELRVEKEDQLQLMATGFYDPSKNNFEFNADFDQLSVVILENVIKETLSGFKGNASGSLKIHGTPDNILIDGALKGDSAGLTIDYTKVKYYFSDSVKFKNNKIIFDNISISDELNNKGIFNGTITHENFKNMEYDLSISSPNILALNTTPRDNGLFYGKIIADGNFYVKGKGTNVELEGDGKALLGSEVNISLDYEQEATQYDFIRFIDKSFRQEEETIFNSSDTTTSLSLQIEVTPDAKAQLIYNSQIGDIIEVQGEGVIQIDMDKNGDMSIFGTYNISQGDYLFTLQNIINKRFTIEPGGSISWSGDPFNATINLMAIYKLRASLYQLFVNNYQGFDNTQRIPVDCKINLSGNLSNPNIGFDIDFPMVETRLVDELQQFFNTEEEMNRQIISLVVLGQFYTPEYLRGSYDASVYSPNLIGSTASELFSNQFSNWLSQISNDFDFGLNYRPGSQVTKDEVELALSTQIFNDRVTLNGNIGNNVNPTGNNNSQIVGDFDLKVKLTNNGKIQLKAFNRSNNNLIYETAPYTQGIGLIFKEEYNTFEELLDNLLSLFTNK